jgi:hypothetical protein
VRLAGEDGGAAGGRLLRRREGHERLEPERERDRIGKKEKSFINF